MFHDIIFNQCCQMLASTIVDSTLMTIWISFVVVVTNRLCCYIIWRHMKDNFVDNAESSDYVCESSISQSWCSGGDGGWSSRYQDYWGYHFNVEWCINVTGLLYLWWGEGQHDRVCGVRRAVCSLLENVTVFHRNNHNNKDTKICILVLRLIHGEIPTQSSQYKTWIFLIYSHLDPNQNFEWSIYQTVSRILLTYLQITCILIPTQTSIFLCKTVNHAHSSSLSEHPFSP